MAEFHACPVCRSRVPGFAPLPQSFLDMVRGYGFIHPVDQFETLNLGAYSCPNCGAADRDRLYASFFEPVFVRLDRSRSHRFLEIAPAAALSRWIRSHPHIAHRTCDLFMPGVDDKADIHDLPYADATYDFVLCSHVLEHVEDPVKAISEIRRVLKPNGVALLMVPILLTLDETYEDPSIVTPQDRWKHFGQDDHVRIFSKKGFVETIRKGGLAVEEIPVTRMMSPAEAETLGIGTGSVLYLCSHVALA